jgi:hypothetical protein
MSDGELEQVVVGCNIYARASPENKLRIVRALQVGVCLEKGGKCPGEGGKGGGNGREGGRLVMEGRKGSAIPTCGRTTMLLLSFDKVWSERVLAMFD